MKTFLIITIILFSGKSCSSQEKINEISTPTITQSEIKSDDSNNLFLPVTEENIDSIIQTNLYGDKKIDGMSYGDSKNNVVLVNLWAYWCQPCKEEFPEIVKLKNNYSDKGLKVIFITLDFGDALETQSKPYLESQGVDWVSYYNKFAKDENLIEYFSKDWDGGIPGTFIYGKDGKLAKQMIGKKTYEEFEDVVKELL
ncbi:MAG TPA: TlpA disulfide reductase family protein [Ignavibacteria bacterium]|nr:TlpA disulfide reductase family protein [Ignavibacteria bacterium]